MSSSIVKSFCIRKNKVYQLVMNSRPEYTLLDMAYDLIVDFDYSSTAADPDSNFCCSFSLFNFMKLWGRIRCRGLNLFQHSLSKLSETIIISVLHDTVDGIPFFNSHAAFIFCFTIEAQPFIRTWTTSFIVRYLLEKLYKLEFKFLQFFKY